MSQDSKLATSGASTEQPADSPEVIELEDGIARTRDDLARTVDLLAAKVDVKTRLNDRVRETREAAMAQVRVARTHVIDPEGRPTPAAVSLGGGVIAAIMAVVLVRLWSRPARRRTTWTWG